MSRSPWQGVAALAVVGATAVGLRWASRPAPSIENVRMGPGGWVSLRNVPGVRVAKDADRPWWAKLIGAQRLETVNPTVAGSFLQRTRHLRALRKKAS